MQLVREKILSLSATGLICSTTNKSSNLRLLTFAIKGYTPRQCFTWGWPLHLHLSAGIGQISECRVKYYVPEYELIPPYSSVDTWRDYCEAKRHMHKGKIERAAIERNNETN